MAPLIECVPNFSEGRRPEVIEAIASAIRAAPGAQLLNVSSDHDHNRTVITMAGAPEGVEAAAFAAIAKAAELIDLDRHTGEHPRLGATDVVPFIPIRDATMADCVAIARRLGERVGRELNIPVYLYEAAATRPDRENLENIRRGQYEALKVEIETNPDRKPDFGPAKLGKAGATVIGARPFLVAYNVYLTTSDVEIAKKIAKALRHSSGGLRFVKALGLLVEGQAQVSMNLTDFNKTPVHRAVEMIRREAARYGCAIVRSELVGMIPQAALMDAAQWYLQLDGLQSDQILENKLVQAAGQAGTS
ncbi:MAG: glutamate formimidoyltransferase, partial [Chloroflexi bacterium]|nr:glutamate formimidoyltransferase [Chloroflexota bacterium]